jgi:hypothetical protein
MQVSHPKVDYPGVEVVYVYPRCPYREVTHAAARRVPVIRKVAALLWPAARRAEWVHIDSLGIEAAGLAGETQIPWNDVCSTTTSRSPLGRQTLVISDGKGHRIVVASTLPEFADLSRRVSEEAGTQIAVVPPAARAA